MKPSEAIKPVSYLKANTADVLRELNDSRKAIIITQNGEARAVMQDVATFEQTQETLALLKLIAQGKQSIEEGRTKPLRSAIREIRKRLKTDSL